MEPRAQPGSGSGSGYDWARLRDRCLVALTALAFAAAAIWLLGHLFRIAAMVMFALVVAYALEPALKKAERRVPRAVAALGVFAAAVVVAAGAVLLLGGLVLNEAVQLLAALPGDLNQGADRIQTQLAFKGIPVPFLGASTATAQLQHGVSGGMTGFLQAAFNALGLVAAAAVDVVITAVMAFYFMVDGKRMRIALANLVPDPHRDKVVFVEEVVDGVLGSYIRGQLILATTVGMLAAAGCALLGVRYPLLIGILAFVFELVPMVGPILASLPAIVIALFQPFPLVLYVAAYFLVLQMLENHVLVPRISGGAVGLHPLVALVALLAGAEAAGALGALFAVPAAGILNVLATAAWSAWHGQTVAIERGTAGFRLRRAKPRRAPKAA
jgi:predicted PurR-regulated permease PerM